MALLTVAQCKDYLRIQHTAEDAMLATWLAMATAQVEAELGRPLASAQRTWVDRAETNRAYGLVDRLLVPVTPFDPTSLVIVDREAATLVVVTDYEAPTSPWAGVVVAAKGMSFANGPYEITADVGLPEAAEYSTIIEPTLNAAILDLVADRYQRRNPNASSESAGGGVSTSYAANGLPLRVMQMLAPWRAVRL